MAGFASFNDLINALTVNKRQQAPFIQKLLPSTTVAGVPHTFWKATGMPGAGSDPSAGLNSAAACTKATAGAVLFINESGGRTLHALSASLMSTINVGTIYVCDRLAHANLSISQASGSFSPVIDGTGRLAAGEGAMIFMEVTTALGTGTNTFTLDYTDQDGNAGTTASVTTVASAVAGRVPYASALWAPLAAGDSGARTITGWTLSSGSQTGNVNICLVKPLFEVPLILASAAGVRDLVTQTPELPQIKDDACLFFILVPAAAGTYNMMGRLLMCGN